MATDGVVFDTEGNNIFNHQSRFGGLFVPVSFTCLCKFYMPAYGIAIYVQEGVMESKSQHHQIC